MIILLVFTEEKVISKLYFTCYYKYSKFDFTRCFLDERGTHQLESVVE